MDYPLNKIIVQQKINTAQLPMEKTASLDEAELSKRCLRSIMGYEDNSQSYPNVPASVMSLYTPPPLPPTNTLYRPNAVYNYNDHIQYNGYGHYNSYNHYNNKNIYGYNNYDPKYKKKIEKFKEQQRYEKIQTKIELMKGTPEYKEIMDKIDIGKKNTNEEFTKKYREKKEELHNEIEKIQKQRNKISGHGVSGLVNLGNSCYLNSVLQTLNHSQPLVNYILNKEYIDVLELKFTAEYLEKLNNESITLSSAEISINGTLILDAKLAQEYINKTLCSKMFNLMTHLWGKNERIKPVTMREYIIELSEIFKDKDQQDSQELLTYIIAKLHDETKQNIYNDENANKYKQKLLDSRPEMELNSGQVLDDKIFNTFVDFWTKHYLSEYSPITEYFTGVEATITECDICGNQSIRMVIFTSLTLSMPDGSCTIEELFKRDYDTKESLNGDNCYFCDVCGEKTEAVTYKKIILPPKILIIMFIRFAFTFDNVSNDFVFKKKETSVNYPINNLNIDTATINKGAISLIHKFGQNNTFDIFTDYDLCSVIKHIGSTIKSGHYVCSCKNNSNNIWYDFNDDTIHHIPEDKLNSALIHKDSYVLFYSCIKEKINLMQ